MDFFNEKIRNYIASNLDLDNQFKYEKFMVGRSNITFKIFDNRNSYVLRRPPFGDKLESAHNMQREYRIISCLLYTSPSPRDQRGSRMPSSA